MSQKKIMFIMFPGFGVSKKGWDTHYEKSTGLYIKTNFISKLKKMGSVYFYEPLYYNINYYILNEPEKSLYNKKTIKREYNKYFFQLSTYKSVFYSYLFY